MNEEIAPGRYFAKPGAGCFWSRLDAGGGLLASEFTPFDEGQEIVDIAIADHLFESDADCGTWRASPSPFVAPDRIPRGRWLVGEQVEPGDYATDAGAGCYWARLRHFSGETRLDVIANEFLPTGGRRSVTITSTDIGFFSDAACGEWTRTGDVSGSPAAEATRTLAELEEDRERYRTYRATRQIR